MWQKSPCAFLFCGESFDWNLRQQFQVLWHLQNTWSFLSSNTSISWIILMFEKDHWAIFNSFRCFPFSPPPQKKIERAEICTVNQCCVKHRNNEISEVSVGIVPMSVFHWIAIPVFQKKKPKKHRLAKTKRICVFLICCLWQSDRLSFCPIFVELRFDAVALTPRYVKILWYLRCLLTWINKNSNKTKLLLGQKIPCVTLNLPRRNKFKTMRTESDQDVRATQIFYVFAKKGDFEPKGSFFVLERHKNKHCSIFFSAPIHFPQTCTQRNSTGLHRQPQFTTSSLLRVKDLV